jgi:hypothetical protein
VVIGAARIGSGGPLRARDVEAAIQRIEAPAAGVVVGGSRASASFHAATSDLRRQLLLGALEVAKGNQTRAGVLLGLHGTRGEAGGNLDSRARKRAHRKFRYWWQRLVEESG